MADINEWDHMEQYWHQLCNADVCTNGYIDCNKILQGNCNEYIWSSMQLYF
jgi:hypothetical protein